jgi:hypothetical protein
MPTNFSLRKKHSSTFVKKSKKTKKEDDFFKDADDFLKNSGEDTSRKS